MSENYVEIHEAVKILDGNRVLDNVTLSLARGTITGLKGHNGSGKTMLLRAISGLITLNSGYVSVGGQRIGRDISFPPSLGLMIENAGVWNYLTGYENLRMLADIQKKIGGDEIIDAIRRVGLDPDDKKKYRKYSLGMKKRLILAQAIMEKPDLILLDEPTNALDADGVKLAKSILLEEKERGAAILIVSHLSDDLQTMCGTVYRMDSGRMDVDQ